MEAAGGVCALAAVAAVPLLLFYYLTRKTPPNVGRQHGGGIDGAGPAFGYPPKDQSPKPPWPSSPGKDEKKRRDP